MPFTDSGLHQFKIVKGAILMVYKGTPKGLCTTLRDQVNEDLFAFCKTLAGESAIDQVKEPSQVVSRKARSMSSALTEGIQP